MRCAWRAATSTWRASQLELTRAGAWVYDIRNQERQVDALRKAAAASTALLGKYVIRAPVDGVVMSVNTAVGAYVSSQGTYGTYTQANTPVIVMGSAPGTLAVRVYVDEILLQRLPSAKSGQAMQGRMFVRGTNTSIPLEFVRTQPYVTPKIQLSDQRTERVDVRVLPLLTRPISATCKPGLSGCRTPWPCSWRWAGAGTPAPSVQAGQALRTTVS